MVVEFVDNTYINFLWSTFFMSGAVLAYHFPEIWKEYFETEPVPTEFELDCYFVQNYWDAWYKLNYPEIIEQKNLNEYYIKALANDIDPTTFFYGNLVYFASNGVIFLFIIFVGKKLIETIKNYNLYSFNNKMLTSVNFFKKAVLDRFNYIITNDLLEYDHSVYQNMIQYLDKLIKTEFWNSQSLVELNSIRHDLADFQTILADNDDLSLHYDFALFNKVFSSKVDYIEAEDLTYKNENEK